MQPFDLNCMIGPTNTDREKSFRTPEALLAEMDRYGIAETLVYASQARMAHPSDGNGYLVDLVRDHDRLHACWVVMPPGTGEQPEPKALVSQIQANDVRAVRIFPNEHNFPLLEQTFRPLLEALSDARIPLLVDTGRTSWGQLALDWREVFDIAERHPNMSLVLLREGGSTARVLFGVWDAFPNIHLETSYIQESRIVEEITERFGDERLVFGTGLPFWDAGGPLGVLRGARVSEGVRTKIAGNTARRLFGLAEVPAGEPGTWPCGPKGFRVFDVHGHLGLWDRKYYRDGSAEEMVERMDQVGVDRFAVSDILAIGPDYRRGNDRVGEAVRTHPDRLVGYVVYNPNYESEMGDEMARGFEVLGCTGIKIHCSLHETSTEDASYRLAFRTAQDQGCPVLCHVHQGPTPSFLSALLADHPDMTFIYAHIGGGGREPLERWLEVALERPNLCFDLGVSNMPRGTLGWLVKQVPVPQIVYGSDHPLNGFTFQLGRVLHADISDNVKRQILWDNAARIFRVH